MTIKDRFVWFTLGLVVGVIVMFFYTLSRAVDVNYAEETQKTDEIVRSISDIVSADNARIEVEKKESAERLVKIRDEVKSEITAAGSDDLIDIALREISIFDEYERRDPAEGFAWMDGYERRVFSQ